MREVVIVCGLFLCSGVVLMNEVVYCIKCSVSNSSALSSAHMFSYGYLFSRHLCKYLIGK